MTTAKLCPRCLEPLGEKALVANVGGAELCAVCAAAKVGEDVGVDADLAQGLMATLLGQSRGNVFLTSYAQRRGLGDAPAGPPMDPVVAQGLGLISDLARGMRARPKTALRRRLAALKKKSRRKR